MSTGIKINVYAKGDPERFAEQISEAMRRTQAAWGTTPGTGALARHERDRSRRRAAERRQRVKARRQAKGWPS